jgi:hypothetical protein
VAGADAAQCSEAGKERWGVYMQQEPHKGANVNGEREGGLLELHGRPTGSSQPHPLPLHLASSVSSWTASPSAAFHGLSAEQPASPGDWGFKSRARGFTRLELNLKTTLKTTKNN